ncbi:MAG: VCBS repeat-containing protein, partial [FCB group bacterium]|nr:VCBS repeat-containing protein [FCB group bacterium]
AFVDIDSDGDLDCFVGGYFGTIHYFRNDGDSVNYDFTYVTDNYMGIDVGDYSVPYFCDIDNDGDYDLFVGEGGYPESYTPYLGLGDVNFYENVGDCFNADFVLRHQNLLTLDIEFNSYPTFSDIDNDGDYDLFLGESQGNLNFFRNIGTTVSPSFVLETEFFNEEFFGWQCTPSFIDLDADGDQDLIIGCGVGFGQTEVRVYRNDGPLPNPNFTLIDDNLLPFTVNDANQYLVDIDNDNDYDMFVGDGNGNLGFYRNLGDSARYNFVLEIINVIGTWEYDPFPVLLDIDHDDDYDLFAGGCGRLVFFLNIGTPEVFNFVLEADTFCNIYNSPGNCYPAFCDIDGDDDSDLFFGEVDGGLQFYRNQANPSSVVLTVSISPPDVILNWNPIAGASEYNIYTDDTPYFLPTGLPAFTVLPPDTFYIHSGVMNSNTKLFYRMKVVNE